MHELQRLQYLDALGIDSFMPRLVLPHCKPSALCEFPEALLVTEKIVTEKVVTEEMVAEKVFVEKAPVENVLAQNDQATTLEAPVEQHFREAGEVVAGILDKSAAGNKATGASSPIVDPPRVDREKNLAAAPAAQSKAQEKVEFSLSLWRIGEHIQVADSRRLGEALPTHKLIENIASGMRYQQQPLAGADILNWPLVGGGHDASWSAAEQMVQGFLEGKLTQQATQYFWLMGKEACRCVLGETYSYESLLFQAPVSMPQFSAQALILPSLAEILFQPALKKTVWLSLVKHIHLDG